MTDDRDETLGNSGQEPAAELPTVAVSRRTVLRGATAAVPTILTLHSGAALALASNYVSPTQNAAAFVPKGYTEPHYACIDVSGTTDGPPYYFGHGLDPYLVPANSLFVSTQNLGLSASDLLDEVKVKNAVKDLSNPLNAGQICTPAGGTYVQVVYGTNGKLQPVIFNGVPKIVTMPATAMLSLNAWSSLDSAGKLFTPYNFV